MWNYKGRKNSVETKPVKVEKQEEKPAEKPAYYNPGKERSKLEKKIEKAEEKIAFFESEIQRLKDELLNPAYATDFEKLSKIQEEMDANEEKLLETMEEWSLLDKQLGEIG